MASLKMVSVLVDQGDNRNTLPTSIPAYELPVLRAIYEGKKGGKVTEGESAWIAVPDVDAGMFYERMLAKYGGSKEANQALAGVYPTREYFAERLERYVDESDPEPTTPDPAIDETAQDALTEERLALDAEREALAKERAELDALRAELAKAKEATAAAAKPADPPKADATKPADQPSSTTKPA